MTAALTPLPDSAALRALSRTQLEDFALETAIARCKLEQRVAALEAQVASAPTLPAASPEQSEHGGVLHGHKPSTSKPGKR